METSEQIKRFAKFLKQYYHAHLLEQVRKGDKFLNVDFESFASFDSDLADMILDS